MKRLLPLLLFFVSCHHAVYLTDRHYSTVRMDSTSTEADARIAAMIAPYKAEVDKEMNITIGEAGTELTRAQPEGTLGNFMADALMHQSTKTAGKPIDLAIVNNGGIRIPRIPIGSIAKGKIYELMPFENMITIMQVDGQTLRLLFDRMAESKGWPVSHGCSYTIRGTAAVNIVINGAPLDDAKTYSVAISDYIANGGDACPFLVKTPRVETGILVRDAIINYVTELAAKGQKVMGVVEGRVKN